MRKRSNPAPGDGGARGLAIVGVAAVVIIVGGVVGVATDWTFGIGGGGDGSGGTGATTCDHDATGRYASVRTTKGTFVLELLEGKAPRTVANFQSYARSGFFDGTIFHRVSPDFVVQGGGFLPDGEDKANERAPIPLEAGESNVARTVAMARTNAPDSATSEFFVNMKDNSASLDPKPGSPGYAVFAEVVDGWSVVEKIANAPTKANPILQGDGETYPTTPIVMKCVELMPAYGDERTGFDFYAFDDDYDVAPGGLVSFPVVVRNTGNVPLAINLTADFGGWTGALETGHVNVNVAADGGDVNLVGMQAPANATGEHTVTVTATPDQGEPKTLEFAIVVNPDIGGTRAGEEENNLVQVRYLGIYDDGRIFDTNIAAVWENDDLPRALAPGSGPHTAPFKAYLGTGESSVSGYGTVIVGFREAIVGLAEGETAGSRLPPEKAYQDGKVRLFMMSVLSIDGTG